MIDRELGRTGLKVSQLGFGAMRFPMVGEGDDARVDRDQAIPMIHRALDADVNYIDTAVFYCNGDSQRVLGEALQGRREGVVISTKNHCYGEDEAEWWKLLEQSLDRLRVDCIDLYNHHGVNRERWTNDVEPRVAGWMRKAKAQGLIKHIGCSFHDGNDSLIHLVDTGYPSVITLQYNMLDRQLEEGIAHAHQNGIGIVVMGPVGGGRLGASSEVLEGLLPDIRRVPELAIRFVLSNPHVSVCLSGMGTMAQVEENVATASDAVALSESDKAAIAEHLQRLKAMAELYCTACGYCMPCPHDVNIPAVFERFNRGRVYALWDNAREAYGGLLGKGHGADRCAECGECVDKCPQRLDIPAQLKTAHSVLTRRP